MSNAKTVNISVEEFSKLHSQLAALKNENFEFKEREKKLVAELDHYKKQYIATDKEYKKLTAVIQRSKELNAIRNLESDVENMRKAIEMMNHEHRGQHETLRKTIASLTEENDSLKQQLADAQTESQQMLAKVDELTKKDTQTRQEYTKYQAQIIELESQISMLKQGIDINETQTTTTTTTTATTAATTTDAAADTEQSTEESTETSSISESTTENQSEPNGDHQSDEQQQQQQQMVHIPAATHAAQLALISSLQQSMAELKANLELDVKLLTNERDELRTEVEGLNQQIELWKEKSKHKKQLHQELETETEALRQQLKQLHELQQREEELTAELQQREDHYKHELAKRDQLLATETTQRDEQHQKAISELEEQHRRDATKADEQHRSELQKRDDHWKSEMSKREEVSKAEMYKRDTSISALKTELANSKADCDNILKKLAQTEEQKTKYFTASEATARQLRETQISLEQSTKQVHQLETQVRQLQTEKQNLQQQLKDMEQTYQKGLKFDEEQRIKVEALAKIEKLESTVKDLQAKLTQSEKTCSELNAQTAEDAAKLQSLNERIDALQIDIDAVTKEKIKIASDAKKLASHAHEREAYLSAEIEEAKVQQQTLETRIQTLETEANHLQQQCNKLAAEKEALRLQAEEDSAKAEQALEALKQLEQRREDVKQQIEQLKQQNEQLETQLRDAQVELKAEEKRNKQMVRELRTQLQREKTQREQAEVMLIGKSTITNPDFSAGGVLATADSTPSSARSSIDLGSVSAPSPMMSPIGPSNVSGSHSASRKASFHSRTSSSSEAPFHGVEAIANENAILAKRVGELKVLQYHLEEKIKMLEADNIYKREELEKKSRILTSYYQREKLGRLEPEQEKDKMERASKSTSLMGSLFAGKSPNKQLTQKVSMEVYTKMQQVLEETILKNMQLQDDIQVLGKDVSKLMQENESLKQRVTEQGAPIESQNTTES